MKKILSILLLSLCLILLLISFNACKKTKTEVDRAPYLSNDISTFLSDWKYAQSHSFPMGDAREFLIASDDDNDGTVSVKIPKIMSDDFKFCQASASEYGDDYKFTFNPSSTEGNLYDPINGISVSISKSSKSFESCTSDLSVKDGFAYDAELNRWIIDDNEKVIVIYFPDNIILQDGSEISNYFTFEEHSASFAKSLTDDSSGGCR